MRYRQSKFSESEIYEMVRLWDSGEMNQTEIGKKFGMSRQAIHHLIRYRSKTRGRVVSEVEKLNTDNNRLNRFFKSFVIFPNGCWIWIGSIGINGYGIFTYKDVKSAHRASWTIHKGDIEDGLNVLHKCNNKRCVNPNHLYLGTQVDNMRDRFDEVINNFTLKTKGK